VSIPVAAGCGATLTDRPPHGRGTRDYLDDVLPNQDASCLPESELFALDPRHGVDFILQMLFEGDRDIIPVTIGAMTNLAVALVKEPRVASRIPRIVAMAGGIRSGFAEWNIACDPAAASLVFESGVPIDLMPIEVTSTVVFTPEEMDELKKADRPLPANLCAAVRFWQGQEGTMMPTLHDPLAVMALLKPELFEWKRGRVHVELQGRYTHGFTTFREDPNGPHRVAVSARRNDAVRLYLDRVSRL
jgi:purine nucleosidase